MTVTMLAAFAFVGVVYYFSSAGGGVVDESLVNRLPLQLTPALLFYLFLLLHRGASHPDPLPASRGEAVEDRAATPL